MKIVKLITFIVIVIGAINWGLVGFFDYNLVDAIFGAGSVGARVVYGVVGVAGIAAIIEKIVCMAKGKKD